MTKISIVIPAYNSELCLQETLESALAQTRPAHEILVVDDGSTDRTEEIVRSFGNRIRYVKQQNQGIAGARNTGIREATGDWIAFLDHDDLILPQKLQRQTAAIEANPNLVVVYSAFTYLYPDGKTVRVDAFPANQLWPAIRYRTPILPSTAVIRRSALQEIGGFQKVYCVDDWNLWFRLVRRYSAEAFQDLPESFTIYRWWENNESKKFMAVAEAALGLLDTLLVEDLTGLKKMMWKRIVEARIYYGLCLNLREVNNDRAWEFAIESLLRWPFWGSVITPHRYRVFAHMLWTRVRRFRLNFRYWWPVRRCRENLTLSV